MLYTLCYHLFVNIFKIITEMFCMCKKVSYLYIITKTQNKKTMLDLSKYSETNKTVTFTNGKTFEVYSKQTKAGVRFFYYSHKNFRMMPVSKKDIK